MVVEMADILCFTDMTTAGFMAMAFGTGILEKILGC